MSVQVLLLLVLSLPNQYGSQEFVQNKSQRFVPIGGTVEAACVALHRKILLCFVPVGELPKFPQVRLSQEYRTKTFCLFFAKKERLYLSLRQSISSKL
jgi:hypothetical protein